MTREEDLAKNEEMPFRLVMWPHSAWPIALFIGNEEYGLSEEDAKQLVSLLNSALSRVTS